MENQTCITSIHGLQYTYCKHIKFNALWVPIRKNIVRCYHSRFWVTIYWLIGEKETVNLQSPWNCVHGHTYVESISRWTQNVHILEADAQVQGKWRIHLPSKAAASSNLPSCLNFRSCSFNSSIFRWRSCSDNFFHSASPTYKECDK